MKRKVKWVPVYETGDLLSNGKKAKPIGRMRDPDATIGVVLDSAAWRHLFGESVKFGGTPGPRRRPSKINA